MSRTSKTARESHEYRHGYKILDKGQGGTQAVPRQAQSTCERVFGMSETDLKLIVGELVGAAKSIKEAYEKQEKSQAEYAKKQEAANKAIDERLEKLEDLVKNGKFLRLIARIVGYPIIALIIANFSNIWNFVKKIV